MRLKEFRALYESGQSFCEGKVSACRFDYDSDQFRYNELKKAMKRKPNPSADEPSCEDLLGGWHHSEFSQVVNYGNGQFTFYEGWIDSCFEGLYDKPGYAGLTETEALEKFIRERFSKIAKAAGMKIVSWELDDSCGDGTIMAIHLQK